MGIIRYIPPNNTLPRLLYGSFPLILPHHVTLRNNNSEVIATEPPYLNDLTSRFRVHYSCGVYIYSLYNSGGIDVPPYAVRGAERSLPQKKSSHT